MCCSANIALSIYQLIATAVVQSSWLFPILCGTFSNGEADTVGGIQTVPCTEKSRSICLNNGTCLLTSRSAAYQFCHNDESYFDGNCYRIFEKLKAWSDANETCQKEGVNNISVWTAGRVLPNGTRSVYIWAPNNHVIGNDFWGEEPGMHNLGERCIEISSRSLYRNWTSSKCSSKNYFVCKRDSKEEMNELANVQCMCRDGHRGTFCDKSFNESDIKFQSQSFACVDDMFEFSCPNGGVIVVDFAAYGNVGDSYKLCLNAPQAKVNTTDWEICIHPSSLQTMISMCQGLTYCRINDLQSLFPDNPCLSITPIILQYRMRCLNEPIVKCPQGAVYRNGRCYLAYLREEPLSFSDSKKRCRKEGGQLAFSIEQTATNEIVSSIQSQTGHVNGSCFWMDKSERLRNVLQCACYYVTTGNIFWSRKSCDSKQQWVCEFAPETTNPRPVEVYRRPMEHHIIFNGQSKPVNSTINDSVSDTNSLPKRSFCEAHQWNGITIPRAVACSESQAACPETAGVVTQRCGCETSEWEDEPNTLNCTQKWFGLLNELIDEDAPAEDISQQWAQLLQNSTGKMLNGGDIVNSIEIGEKLLSLARIQYAVLDNRNERSIKATKFTQAYGEAGDELLSEHATKVWMTLPINIRVPKASTLMSILEQSAALMADFIVEKQIKIDYSNWALEVQVKKPPPVALRESDTSVFNDDAPLTPRSRGFASGTDANTPAAMLMASTNFDESVGNITFNSFSLSPILSMPPLKILQQSTEPSIHHPSTFDDFGAIAQPRTRFKSLDLDRNPLRLGYYVFKSMGKLLSHNKTTFINSLVIGASVNNPMISISLPRSNPVTFKFYHIKTKDVRNPRCVFWDTVNNDWSEKGCTMLRSSSDSTDCSCTHLTSFAILMDINESYDFGAKSVANEILNLVTIVGCTFSIACLSLTLLVFTCFRSLWSIRHTIHRNLCLCLLLAEIIFVFGIDRTENKVICRTVAVALHYFFLAAFCWMLLEGYQLYLMLIQVFETDEVKTVLYYLYAYGFPAVIVAVTAGIAWPNYSTDRYCWLNVETPTIWAFAGPVAVVIVSNLVFLGVALRVVLSVRSGDRSRIEQMLRWLKGSATLLCLLGVTWIFGYLMVIQGMQTVFAYIFTVLNCVQGVFIFVIHVILNDKVRLTVLRFLRLNVCCISDPAPGSSVLSSRQKFANFMKNGDLSNHSSQPSTQRNALGDIKANKNKGIFVEKTPSSMNTAGSPATMITYLDWKAKLNSGSGSIPSDDSGNSECEPKEARSISDEIEVNTELIQKDSDSGIEWQSFPTNQQGNDYRRRGSKLHPNRTLEDSTIVERF